MTLIIAYPAHDFPLPFPSSGFSIENHHINTLKRVGGMGMSHRAENSTVRNFVTGLSFTLIFFSQAWLPYAQQLPPEVEQMGYADTVFLNGKIVSMDDASYLSLVRGYAGICGS